MLVADLWTDYDDTLASVALRWGPFSFLLNDQCLTFWHNVLQNCLGTTLHSIRYSEHNSYLDVVFLLPVEGLLYTLCVHDSRLAREYYEF